MTIDTDLSTPLDQVRIIIGDLEGEFISDQTISALLLANDDNVNRTAIQCVRFIIADLAKCIDETVGDESVKFSQLYDHYRNLLSDLLINPAYSSVGIGHILGGVSCSQANKVYSNSDSRHINIREGFGTRVNNTRLNPNNPFFLEDDDCGC